MKNLRYYNVNIILRQSFIIEFLGVQNKIKKYFIDQPKKTR